MVKRTEEKTVHAVTSNRSGISIVPRYASGKVRFDVISKGAFTKGCPSENLEEIILQFHSGKNNNEKQAVNL